MGGLQFATGYVGVGGDWLGVFVATGGGGGSGATPAQLLDGADARALAFMEAPCGLTLVVGVDGDPGALMQVVFAPLLQ
jgi:hypothetical protein